MTMTIDYPDLDAAIDAESWQWLQDAAAIIEDTRREMTNRALDDAGAAERGLLALVAEVARLRDLVALGTLDGDALAAAGHALRDLRRQVEALGVGL